MLKNQNIRSRPQEKMWRVKKQAHKNQTKHKKNIKMNKRSNIKCNK